MEDKTKEEYEKKKDTQRKYIHTHIKASHRQKPIPSDTHYSHN